MQDKLETIRSNVLQLLDMVNVVNGGKTSALARQAEQFFFERNADIASIGKFFRKMILPARMETICS